MSGGEETWVNVRTLRRELSHWIGKAAYGGERVIVAPHGRPRAALVCLRDLRRLQSWERDRGAGPYSALSKSR